MTHVFRFPESRILNPNCHTELLPSPTQVKIRFPATSAQLSLVADTRTNIRAILSGQSSKRLLVVGPCSIHNLHSAKEYAIRLRDLALQVKDQFVIVMRAYFEKPRTTTGWKGLLYDPHLDGSNDIIEGLYLSRQMLLDLAGLGVPAATEFLDPVFSSGVTLATVSSQLAGKLVIRTLKGQPVDWDAEYMRPMMQGIDTFRSYVEAWYEGTLDTIFFADNQDPLIKSQICSVLGGYVWDLANPYVKNHNSALHRLASVIRYRDSLVP